MTLEELAEQANYLKKENCRLISDCNSESKRASIAEQKVVVLETALDAMARRILDLE